MVVAQRLIRVCGPSNRERHNQILALQLVPFRAIGEVECEHLIQPGPQQSRHRVPVERKPQNNDVGPSPALIGNDTDLIVDAAKKGLGIGRVLTPIVAKEFARGELRPILRRHWAEVAGLHLYFPQHSQKAKRNRVLIDYLCENAIKH